MGEKAGKQVSPSPKQFEPFPKQAPDLMFLQYTSFERLWEKEKWFVLDGYTTLREWEKKLVNSIFSYT